MVSNLRDTRHSLQHGLYPSAPLSLCPAAIALEHPRPHARQQVATRLHKAFNPTEIQIGLS